MPSITIYIKDAEYVRLIKEENPSKLIQQLLKDHYEPATEPPETPKEPKVENGSSA